MYDADKGDCIIMKICIINLSPRGKGTSNMLVNYFSQELVHKSCVTKTINLYPNLEHIERVLNEIKEADSIILIGPSYVDTFPADTLRLLDYMEETPGILHGQYIYAFIQGGMPYIHTHESGIRMIRNFAADNGLVFGGGYVMGGGAVLNGQPLEKAIGAKKIVPAVNRMIEMISAQKEFGRELCENATMKVPFFLAVFLKIFMCYSIRKNLANLGADYKQKSRYLI